MFVDFQFSLSPNKLSKNLLLTSDMNSFRPGVAPVFVPDTGNAPEIDPVSCCFNFFWYILESSSFSLLQKH